jgi:ribosomal protein L11 methylase PrmA
MLELAAVKPSDVVYDLGCGDGRIVIAAARELGARGVGIDIDPERIRESRENARAAGVIDRVTFRNEDLFEAEIGDATVVMLFLWPEVNLKLRPKLLSELAPGTRIVSFWHDMGDWKAERVVDVDIDGGSQSIYLWRVPQR